MHELKWFTDRIWKRIYRDKNTCNCNTCKDVSENWLIIADENHASYLEMCQVMNTYRDNQ